MDLSFQPTTWAALGDLVRDLAERFPSERRFLSPALAMVEGGAAKDPDGLGLPMAAESIRQMLTPMKG